MKKIICFCFAFFGFVTARAQGWERLYPDIVGSTNFYNLAPMPDGGFIFTGDNSLPPNGDHLLLRIASNGQPQWVINQNQFFTYRPALLPVENNQMLFASLGSSATLLVKTNSSLQEVWSQTINGTLFSGGIAPPRLQIVSDGYLLAYQTELNFGNVRVTKVNFNGGVEWQNEYDFNDWGFVMLAFYDMIVDNQGNFYLSGVQDFPLNPFLAKISPLGNLVFIKSYNDQLLAHGFTSLALRSDGLIAGVSEKRIAVIDANGDLLYSLSDTVSMIKSSTDDRLITLASNNGQLFLRKIEWDGTIVWQHIFDQAVDFNSVQALWPLSDGGVAGLARFIGATGIAPFIFRTDANGNTYTNQIRGNIFTDLNNDCVFSALADTVRPNILLTAQKGADLFYATTDPAGNYAFTLDSGQYLLRPIPPTDLWTACDDSIAVSLAAIFDTVEVNSAISSPFNCPWPAVNLSAIFLRRCFSNTYTVQYSNEGNIVADSAVVTLILDPFMMLESASVPYNSLGDNSYSFYVGDIAPLQTGIFSVTVLVSCDAELGQIHCSSASIEIANPCPTTGIEIPIIDVEAACEGDSVAFTIKNIGGAPMTNPAEFVVIEDLIVMREGQFQLPAQMDTVLKCPADGSTARMYAGQAPGEPPFFASTAAIEGCNGPVQPGFWQMFPEIFDREDFDRDCQPNIGAYDPNDKQATPTGYAGEHWIARGVPLDYKIRFQNTGTDTAFTVVVRDTLSPGLDPASVRVGAASHAFTWQLLGSGVLEFRFDDILLPDSNVNLAGSQGFLTFQIDQKPGLPLETLIENRAAIFFDFNAPVLTNTTFHRIGENFLPSVSTWEPARPGALLRVAPNPVGTAARLTLPGRASCEGLRLQLFDLQGKMIRSIAGDAAGFLWQNEGLSSGLYFFEITQNDLPVGRGKLMIR